MRTKFSFVMIMLLLAIVSYGQINGSGTLVSKWHPYKDFDKVRLLDINGDVKIDIGKTWSVASEIDSNLAPLLQFSFDEKEHLLTVSFKGNQSNKMYIEKSNLKLTITMPEISVLTQSGNSNCTLNNVNGRYLKIENLSNGNLNASGKVEILDIINSGNGDLVANKLICEKALVTNSGNGDVSLFATLSVDASVSGNGDVVNQGKGTFSSNSIRKGNGTFRRK